MELIEQKDGDLLTVFFKGRLDSNTAPTAEEQLQAALDGVANVVLDFAALDFLSSAGLRTLLTLRKTLTARGGSLKIVGASDGVRQIFAISGLNSIITLE